VAVNGASDRLPCGHHVEQLWSDLARGAPGGHARACEHCQAAAAAISPLLTATGELAAEPARPPDDLVGRVMAVIRTRIPPAPRIALPSPAGIRLQISERAAAVILRAAGDSVEGVHARSCQLTPAAPGKSASTGLKLTISLRYGVPALAAARAVRAAVRTAARGQLGLTLGRIDIEVADVHLA
jgi:uncharacterized alkaline shock family protein YloU